MTAILWGSELSPFFLKIEALCRHAGLPTLRRPDGGSALDNLRLMSRLRMAQARRDVQRWPSPDPLDEYPLVPYLFTDDGKIHYDSSGIAGWLDHARPSQTPLIPRDPALAYVCRLIEEAIDDLRPLLSWVETGFVPLMNANAAAYERCTYAGQARWNEAAFDRGEASFDLDWRGGPARTVVKTFQVRVWRDLCEQASALSEESQRQIRSRGIPMLSGNPNLAVMRA